MRVLVVEDEPKLAAVLRRGLQEAGYAVDLAHDGGEGLLLSQQEPYALIVLDLLLPTLDGLTICRRLRAAGLAVPILILTARDTVDDRVVGLDTGADDYLVKPFAFRELLARMRALLRRESLVRDPILRLGELEVDTTRRQVRRAGRLVELTSKEYMVLEHFARHPNQVLTRAQIAEHVWDFDFVAMSNVVDVYVGYLRRKLGDQKEQRLLRTVRGAGYQLQVPTA